MRDQSLISAAKNGDVAKVLKLLAAGCEAECCVNATDNNGASALIWAMVCNHHLIGKLLLEKGAKPNVVDRSTWSALHAAARQGHKDSVSLLLKNGADPNLQKLKHTETRNSETESDVDDVFECPDCPLKRQLDLNSTGTEGNTPLHLACKFGRIDVVKLLLRYGANPDSVNDIGDRPVDVARSKKHKEIVDLMVFNQREDRIRADLFLAVAASDHSLCEQLLRKSVVINLEFDLQSLLNTAWSRGHLEILKLLLTYKDRTLLPRLNRSSMPTNATDELVKRSQTDPGSSIFQNPQLNDCRHQMSALTVLIQEYNLALSSLEVLVLDLEKQTKLIANLHRKIAYVANVKTVKLGDEKSIGEEITQDLLRELQEATQKETELRREVDQVKNKVTDLKFRKQQIYNELGNFI